MKSTPRFLPALQGASRNPSYLAMVLAATVVLAPATALAQDGDAAAVQATTVGQALRHDHTDLSMAELSRMLPTPRRQGTFYQVPNQLSEAKSMQRSELEKDPLVGPVNATASPQGGVSFDGTGSDDNFNVFGFRIQPPDTNGDVGQDHVVTYTNLVWRVFDKSGTPVIGAAPGNAFWAGFGGVCENENDGDPIVLYDHLAGRWIFSQFAPFSGIQCFAISDGEDPTTGYTRYAFQIEPNGFNDYPKIGVWQSEDGSQSAYTYTGRNFVPQGSPIFARDMTAVLFDRDAMLASNPAAAFTSSVIPGGFSIFDGAQPGHVDNVGTAPGGSCPLFSVASAPSSYRFFEFCENFPGAGVFTTKPSVTVPSFDDGLGAVPQPGGDSLDTLAYFTMYRSSHRNVDGAHRLAMAHTVDAGGDRAGMRWAILDVSNYNAISVIDTGTHAPADGFERWMGSVTLDIEGNLGMGYTRGGNSQFTSVYYTGRETTDPAGTLQTEVGCVTGTGAQTGGGGRWGDYSSTSIDPVDGCTFWTFQEYVETTGSSQFNTRVCSFSFPSCTGNPVDFTLLNTDPGIAGQVNDFPTTNGNPNTGKVFLFGRAQGTSPITVGPCSTTTGLDNPRVFGFALADANGDATFSRSLPAVLASRTLHFQAVDIQPCEVSNVVTTTFQ